MAKKAKGCSAKRITFRTKRGKVVSFTGRAGGDKKNGGVCPHKARKRTPQMRAIATAGRACKKAGRPGTRANIACIRKHFA